MNRWKAFIAALFVVFALGCSGTEAPFAPFTPGDVRDATSNAEAHNLWGLWQGIIDPDVGTIEFAQLRTSEFHLNALPFLEPPALVNITLESLKFNGEQLDADIGIRHPFLGLTEFTGFDVCGIFITSGSVTGFNDSGIIIPGPGDTRLLNPDGLTRWWNPAEFPVNDGTMQSYNDGLLGTPDAVANFTATVNGYKLYTDELQPNDPISVISPDNRNIFSAGQKNIRHYTIKLDGGLIFNYAVDTCWQFPTGSPPWNAPDDFAPGANRPEAWGITTDVTDNTLWNDGVNSGGTLNLGITVLDHFNPGLNTLRIESPGNFTMVESSEPFETGDGYAKYELTTTDAAPAPDYITVMISVLCEEEYSVGLEGKKIASYYEISVPVAEEQYNPCLELTKVADGFHSYFYTKTMQIIYDQSTWEAWWVTAQGSVTPQPPTPKIDWETNMVIAVTMGDFNSSGYYPTIDWACFDENDELEIHVTWHYPGPGCMVLWVFTQPWLAVSAERHEVSHYWTEEEDIYPCD